MAEIITTNPPGVGVHTALGQFPAVKPEILLLCLARRAPVKIVDDLLVECLLRLANVKRAMTTAGAIYAIDNTPIKAIVVTDEVIALPRPDSEVLLEKVKNYVANGGLVFFTFQFPDYLNKHELNTFFEGFGLSWQCGQELRTTHYLVPAANLPKSVRWTILPGPYSMKALHIANATAEEKFFVPIPGAVRASLIFAPGPVDENQAAVTIGKVGDGHLVFCGDILGEQETVGVIVGLIGY